MKSLSAFAIAFLSCGSLSAGRINPLDLLDVPSSTIDNRWSLLADKPGGSDSLVLTNGSCFLVSRIPPATIAAWLADDSASTAAADDGPRNDDDAVGSTPVMLMSVAAIEAGGQLWDKGSRCTLCALLPEASGRRPNECLIARVCERRFTDALCLFPDLLDDANSRFGALVAATASD
jgi:hypothetical protein